MNSYNGLAVTTSGINIVAIINAKAILIPFVVKRENPYAAIAQSTVLITSVRPTISTVIPFTVLILRNFVGEIPISLEEAAAIDGATFSQRLFTIVLPLMKPAIATVCISTLLPA